MTFRIDRRDSLWLGRLKLLYLIPLGTLLWLPIALYLGLKEVGNPYEGVREVWRQGHP